MNSEGLVGRTEERIEEIEEIVVCLVLLASSLAFELALFEFCYLAGNFGNSSF